MKSVGLEAMKNTESKSYLVHMKEGDSNGLRSNIGKSDGDFNKRGNII